MARIDRSGEAFLRALDEAGRSLLAAIDDDPPSPRPNAPPASVHFGGQGGGGEARWNFAMQWTDESVPLLARPASEPTRQPEASRSEMESAIAEELGLGAALTPRQMAARWRDFLWRNHPDRLPPNVRRHAGARVAIANALYDEARWKLATQG